MIFILNIDVCCEEANKVFVSFRDKNRVWRIISLLCLSWVIDILQGLFINGFTDRHEGVTTQV